MDCPAKQAPQSCWLSPSLYMRAISLRKQLSKTGHMSSSRATCAAGCQRHELPAGMPVLLGIHDEKCRTIGHSKVAEPWLRALAHTALHVPVEEEEQRMRPRLFRHVKEGAEDNILGRHLDRDLPPAQGVDAAKLPYLTLPNKVQKWHVLLLRTSLEAAT
eukprot:CAMPEP_0115053188 /NCGR_PEP_ID=MMETSP0227-20121206/3365_1 /TAXON_ID=89957 /ORGANISM="Polarella glacialis, Strain CCMP 1383" /LENGTH=159 /DNA_ID=CAMNT_0002437455 /DNA_START=323 /DNA_END=803 /DNA_ORIENTATION=+